MSHTYVTHVARDIASAPSSKKRQRQDTDGAPTAIAGLSSPAVEEFGRGHRQDAHEHRVPHGFDEPRLLLDRLAQDVRMLPAHVVHQARGILCAHLARISGAQAKLAGDITLPAA